MAYIQHQFKAIESGQHNYDGWTLNMNFRQVARKKPESDPYALIPVGDCVETDWAAWEELVADSEPAANAMHAGSFPKEANRST